MARSEFGSGKSPSISVSALLAKSLLKIGSASFFQIFIIQFSDGILWQQFATYIIYSGAAMKFDDFDFFNHSAGVLAYEAAGVPPSSLKQYNFLLFFS